MRACEYLKQNLSSRDDVLYFDKLFTPHVTYYLRDRQTQELNGADPEPGNLIDASRTTRRTFRLTTDPPAYLGASAAEHFNWPRTSAGASSTLSIRTILRCVGDERQRRTEHSIPLGLASIEAGGGSAGGFRKDRD